MPRCRRQCRSRHLVFVVSVAAFTVIVSVAVATATISSLLIVVCPTAIAVAAGVLIANAAPLPLPPLPPPPLQPPPLLPQPSYRRRAAAALPPHFPPPSRCHRAATIDHFRVGTKYHFAHVEPKIPKSSEKSSKRIKAQKLRNARQILDLARPEKIWPRSQKPKKNKGRHPVSPNHSEVEYFFSDRLLELRDLSGK